MRRHSLKILLALSISGFALAAASSSGSALTVPKSTTLNMKVGHSTFIKLGTGKSFIVANCVSANSTEVPCQLPPAPAHQVEIWCLAPTPLGGVALTVTFTPIGSTNPIPAITITVDCAAAAVPQVRVNNGKIITPLKAVSGLTMNSCAIVPAVIGAACQTIANHLVYTCNVAVTFFTLPKTVNVQVQLEGQPAINNDIMNLSFRCVA